MTVVDPRPPTVRLAGQTYPLTLSSAQAARFLGTTAEQLQAQRGTGRLPVEPLRLGRRLRWPTLEVARAVGLDAELVQPDD